MHFQYLLTTTDIRQANNHLTVKAAGAQQGRIQHVGTVGCRNNDNAFIALKTVHFNQQLVQGLLALVMTTAETRAAMATHRVNFVNEDNTGRLFLGLLEHVAHAGGTHADKHFYEVRTGNGEKRHLGFAGDGLGQQGFTGTGRAHHQHAARNTTAKTLEFAWVAQKLYQLLHVFLGLIDTRHIGKGGFDLIVTQQPRLALAKGHRATPATSTSAALHLAHEKHEHRDNDEDGETGDQQLRPDALFRRLGTAHLDIVIVKIIHQLGIFNHRAHSFEIGVIAAQTTNHKPIDRHLLNAIAADLLDKLGIGQRIGIGFNTEVVEY